MFACLFSGVFDVCWLNCLGDFVSSFCLFVNLYFCWAGAGKEHTTSFAMLVFSKNIKYSQLKKNKVEMFL